jgi:ubiquinone/menaquinone biosynthesis C-methylase UbiE
MDKPQVKADHYNFNKYMDLDRWNSTYYQIRLISSKKPNSVLEVGPGSNILKSLFKDIFKVKNYKTLDIAKDLNPDYLMSVKDIKLGESSFDVVAAFEVLEHLPFKDFDLCLKELFRISKKHVIISLPHYGPVTKFSFKIPYFNHVKSTFKLNLPIKHRFNGEHYWEIGKKGYSANLIRTHLEKFFFIEKDFLIFESDYHHFFVLRKK